MEVETALILGQFENFISERLKKHKEGGRPSFLKLLSREHDIVDEVLDIVELIWLKNKPFGRIAKKYDTSYHTIYRLMQSLEHYKEELIIYLETVPRRKLWYNRDTDSSDYESVQAYIIRARRDGLKTYKNRIMTARRCWTFLKYKDPHNWTADEVCEYLATLSEGMQSGMLDCIRKVAPHLKVQVKTGRYREKLKRRKKDIFGKEIIIIHEALSNHQYLKDIFDLHITLGAREGSRDDYSGITGISWDRFKNNFTTVDLYEAKVRGGIIWKNCPIDLFFKDLPKRMKDLWIERGKPSTKKVILGGYKELLRIYKQIRKILVKYYEGKIEPSLLEEFATLRPHDSDKIHVNLLWEAQIPLEVVAGEYLGQSEGLGLMGRGWLDINTIKKHYLSLTQRSERLQKLRDQVRKYSGRFNRNACETSVKRKNKWIKPIENVSYTD